MKRIAATLLLALCLMPALAQVKTGLEVLKSMNYKPLEGLRVGLVTNPTGVDNNLVSNIDLFHQAENVNLVAIYGPEHGVRGSAHAGKSVTSTKDPITGVPSYSLYGGSKTPTAQNLKGVDVLVYDIQDIGCRSYTYVSTLANVLKGCARNNVKVIVLDRPNPLGGLKVEGNLVEDDCISFISMLKIPYVYGLTSGEVALMLNGENMLGNGLKCDLEVIKMEGWKRSMTYDQTGLHWVLSSPHIPDAITAPYYAMSGIIGDTDRTMSNGVGYTLPFRLFGAYWIDGYKLAERMNALNLPGVIFRPIFYKPFYGHGKDQEIQGVQVHFTDYDKVELTDIQFLIAQELYKLYPNHDFLETLSPSYKNLVDRTCGSKEIRKRFMKRHIWADAKPYWDKDKEAFKELSKKYYLYD